VEKASIPLFAKENAENTSGKMSITRLDLRGRYGTCVVIVRLLLTANAWRMFQKSILIAGHMVHNIFRHHKWCG
jgi:hypothetical protein